MLGELPRLQALDEIQERRSQSMMSIESLQGLLTLAGYEKDEIDTQVSNYALELLKKKEGIFK